MKKLATLAVCGGLLMASCGSDGDSADTPDTAAETTEAPTTEPSETTEAPETTVADTDTTSAPTTEGTSDTTAPETTSVVDDDGVYWVPTEYDTIQAAVDAAQPGELVMIEPGTYNEAVDVSTDELTIRGVDRDGVVLDGELVLDNGIRVLGANGVAVENLTAMNYTNNGVFWVSSEGYRASYITTYRTGDYGIYAFDSVKGQIEYSHTIGSRDAGIYIGQCYLCDAVIDTVISSNNGLGYSGTNSGGNLIIVNSVWHNNRAAIVPNSGSYELCYPERDDHRRQPRVRQQPG
ncbi:MAG: NosD domain-containing protein [Ilumatobacteraceae bacterium]